MGEFLPFAPEWLVIAITVLVALNFAGKTLAEASESWARVLGPLGKRWREIGQRRASERNDLREVRAADLADVTRQRDYFEARAQRCDADLNVREDYIAYDAKWHRETNLKAIEAGCEMPPHTSFRQWLLLPADGS